MITPLDLASATISAVKIRAVTLGLDLPMPDVEDAPFIAAGRFRAPARDQFPAADLEVQPSRVGGADLASGLSQLRRGLKAGAADTEAAAKSHGVENLSLGRGPPPAP